MAGKFTNLRYDNNAYNEDVYMSTKPLIYKLDANYAVNCSPCSSPMGTLSSGQKTDIDSALRGIGKINSRSMQKQCPDPSNQNTYIPPYCTTLLEPQYTRYSHPAYDIKGLNVPDMRFDYPLHDPQCHIFENFQINTKLQAKDDHRTIWQVPLDQKNSLPKEKLGRVKNCTFNINCTYAPYHR